MSPKEYSEFTDLQRKIFDLGEDFREHLYAVIDIEDRCRNLSHTDITRDNLTDIEFEITQTVTQIRRAKEEDAPLASLTDELEEKINSFDRFVKSIENLV